MFFKRFGKVVFVTLLIFISYNHSLYAGNSAKCLSCVGIYPFQNLSNTSKAGVLVSQLFYDGIFSETDWSVINWDTMLKSQELLSINFSDMISNYDLAKLGRKLGLKMILYGTVVKYGYRPLPTGAVIPELLINMKIIECFVF